MQYSHFSTLDICSFVLKNLFNVLRCPLYEINSLLLYRTILCWWSLNVLLCPSCSFFATNQYVLYKNFQIKTCSTIHAFYHSHFASKNYIICLSSIWFLLFFLHIMDTFWLKFFQRNHILQYCFVCS